MRQPQLFTAFVSAAEQAALGIGSSASTVRGRLSTITTDTTRLDPTRYDTHLLSNIKLPFSLPSTFLA
jgi:hypothetical protein